jgi:hypothetical protein
MPRQSILEPCTNRGSRIRRRIRRREVGRRSRGWGPRVARNAGLEDGFAEVWGGRWPVCGGDGIPAVDHRSAGTQAGDDEQGQEGQVIQLTAAAAATVAVSEVSELLEREEGGVGAVPATDLEIAG